MHDLLARCHVFHTPFVRGAADLTAFNAGQQSLGLEIFADVVNNCPNEYVLMMQEQALKETASDRRNDDDNRTTADLAASDPTGSGSDHGWDDNRSDDGDRPAEAGARVSAEGLVIYD
jgi:hypothetical protein